jgi:hypothetical protein
MKGGPGPRSDFSSFMPEAVTRHWRSGVLAVLLSATIQPAAARASACQDLADQVDAAGAGAVFVASYPTAPPGPLQHTAFVYDNAVASLALLGCGERARAERIGDALLYALDHDRYWHDGRVRNAYVAGAVGGGAMRLSGWWDASRQAWLEDRYQAGSDSGNLAWAALALLGLSHTGAGERYAAGAQRIGGWLLQWRDARGAGGFSGGTFAHEPQPQPQRWKSTEHNIDLAVLFTRLAAAYPQPHWREAAASARGFVQAMWQPACGCFAVGTGDDGVTVNPLLALDVQAWALLSGQLGSPQASKYYGALATVERRLRADAGFAYSEALQGLWVEGSAQMALLLELMHQEAQAGALLSAVEALRRPEGYLATSAASEPTGFRLQTDPSQPLQYFHLPHLGATAWVALAQRRFNPFGPAVP